MAEIDREIMSHAITGHNDITHALGNIRNLHGLWYTIIQNTYSRKLWIDYDVDITEEYDKEKLAKDVLDEIDAFAGKIVKKHAVITHGVQISSLLPQTTEQHSQRNSTRKHFLSIYNHLSMIKQRKLSSTAME